MQAIRDSAEHHFLTTLERLKKTPQGWVVLYFSTSKSLKHDQIVKNPKDIHDLMHSASVKADRFFQEIHTHAKSVEGGYAYMFKDLDVLLLTPHKNDQELGYLKELYKDVIQKYDKNFADFSVLEHEFYNYQKIADQKFLSAKCMQAYDEMADTNKISSIGLRRQKREHPLVQVIEDDRFTLTYASKILNPDYDVVLSRNAEEGIIDYIEQAPDIIFIDIHLPGLSGHQALQSVRSIDPDAFAVMLSVDTMKTNIIQASEIGANSFLKKPFSKERLLNVIKTSPHIRDQLRRHTSSHSTH